MSMASTLTKLTLLLVLVAMADASSFWSTFTQNGREGRPLFCPISVTSEHIDSCRGYVRGEPLLAIFAKNNRAPPQQCCDQLNRLRIECRCDAVRDMVRELKEESGSGYQKKGQIEEMQRRAMKLPGMCGTLPPLCVFNMAGY